MNGMAGSMEYVWDRASGELLAIVVYGWQPLGGRFFTKPDAPLQLGVFRHPAGHVVQAHRHLERPRSFSRTAEVVHVAQGSAWLDVYGGEPEDCSRRLVRAGDWALLLGGGHGLEAVEELVLWEVKLGPHAEPDKEAIR